MTLEELVLEYFRDVSVTQYIGARYVPILGRKDEESIQWDGGAAEYEPLTVVLYAGNSYTSRRTVPAGISIDNEYYWANTGNFNGQVAQIRNIIERLSDTVSTFDGRIDNISELLSAETENRIAADTSLEDSIEGEADTRAENDDALQENIDAEAESREDADAALQNGIDSLGARITSLENSENSNIIGGYLAPCYVGDYMENSQFGCCCRVNDLIYTFNPSNYDNEGVVRIFDLHSNVLLNTINDVVMGHANSCCWDSVRNRLWVAPHSVYNNGTSTQTNKLYYYNSSLSTFAAYTMPSEFGTTQSDFVYGISFDATSNSMYAFKAHQNDDTIEVWRMQEDDSDFSLYKTIVSDKIVQTFGSPLWQDFAVYNNVMIACYTDGTTFVIPLFLDVPVVTNTFRIGEIDAGGIWCYGEVEGLEFDSEGRLYNARNANCGLTNDGENYEVNCCFVTELNTSTNISFNNSLRMSVYGTLTVIDKDDNRFNLGRYEIRSINSALWRNDRFARISIPSDNEYVDGRIRMCDRNIKLIVQGKMTVDNIQFDSGTLFFYVDGGNVSLTNATAAAGINVASDASVLYFRCTNGLFTCANAKTISTGWAPVLVAIAEISNIDSLTIEETTVTEPYSLYLGKRLVWSYE